jgi:hypothetical protein
MRRFYKKCKEIIGVSLIVLQKLAKIEKLVCLILVVQFVPVMKFHDNHLATSSDWIKLTSAILGIAGLFGLIYSSRTFQRFWENEEDSGQIIAYIGGGFRVGHRPTSTNRRRSSTGAR